MKPIILFASIALLPAISSAQVQFEATPSAAVGVPVTIPRSQLYDIVSRANSLSYRITVQEPLNGSGQVALPVFYVLDGNQYFGIATDVMARLSRVPNQIPAIVVGIGYPSEDPQVWTARRNLDMTPRGEDAFFRTIVEDIKPFLTARYRIDRSQQALYGQSLGGMFALRIMFRNPGAFSTYVLSSPSIWVNDKEVLADEKEFSNRALSGDLRLKVLLTSASDEQYRGTDPNLLAAAETSRMVDNASELAARLASLGSNGVRLVRTIFEGETHNSVPPSSLTRGIRFALPVN